LALVGILLFAVGIRGELPGLGVIVPVESRLPLDADIVSVPYISDKNDASMGRIPQKVASPIRVSDYPNFYVFSDKRGLLSWLQRGGTNLELIGAIHEFDGLPVSNNGKELHASVDDVCWRPSRIDKAKFQSATDRLVNLSRKSSGYSVPNDQSWTKLQNKRLILDLNLMLDNVNVRFRGARRSSGFVRLLGNRQEREQYRPILYSLGPTKESIPTWKVPLGVFLAFIAIFARGRWGDRTRVDLLTFVTALFAGALIFLGYEDGEPEDQHHSEKVFQAPEMVEHGKNVSQKHLTFTVFL
jgi:hypothetical protein